MTEHHPTHVPLFVGGEISDPGEQALIARLRTDLERASVAATLYANFYAGVRDQRQIDLLVVTAHRTVHAEIKQLNPRWPLHAPCNGPWSQELGDGERRVHDGNYFNQARSGTFAISDALRKLARAARLPEEGKFARHIDTVVAVWEQIPPRSHIDRFSHVTVLSYTDLLARICEPGPSVPWTAEHWERFARELSLYRTGPDTDRERARAATLAAVDEYRAAAADSHRRQLPPMAPVRMHDRDGVTIGFSQLVDAITNGGSVVLTGGSGFGKTHHARHLTLEHLDRGRLVLFARCEEYTGRLSDLLARAAAPYSASYYLDLVNRAVDAGVGVTLVLDGFDSSPARLRQQLLDDVAALRLRHPCSILITSTVTDDLPGPVDARTVTVATPDRSERAQILAVHGAADPNRLCDWFTRPFELAAAATCEAQLKQGATRWELFDAYVRHFMPGERSRDGLRILAAHLHAELTPSTTLLDATNLWASSPAQYRPDEIDELLACPLLHVHRNRVRLAHDLLGQFLAAEHLVRAAAHGADLADRLAAPANQPLREFAIGIETDARRRWVALRALGDAALLTDALCGRYGPDTAGSADDHARQVLRSAVMATDEATWHIDEEGAFPTALRWECPPVDTTTLIAIGSALTAGWWADDVAALIDRSDRRCLEAVQALRDEGHAAAITGVVAATYSPLAASGHLPITAAVHGCRNHRNRTAGGVAARLVAAADLYSWGRYWFGAQLANPADAGDQAIAAALVQRGWNAGGYHLRLAVLYTARWFHDAPETVRTDITDVVTGLSSDNVFLQSELVEVAATFGLVDVGVTVDDIHEAVRDVLAAARNDDNARAAMAIVSRQFDPEDIVGPFSEAVGTLPPQERIALLCRAAMTPDPSMFLDWTVSAIGRAVADDRSTVTTEVIDVLRRHLNAPDLGTVVPQEAVEVWFAALQAWALLGRDLPEVIDETGVWTPLASVLLTALRGEPVDPRRYRTLWDRPQQLLVAVDALRYVFTHDLVPSKANPLGLLYDAVPDQLRPVFEGALAGSTEFTPAFGSSRNSHELFIDALAAVGDEGTVEVLRPWTLDPERGTQAAAAIRRIRERLTAA